MTEEVDRGIDRRLIAAEVHRTIDVEPGALASRGEISHSNYEIRPLGSRDLVRLRLVGGAPVICVPLLLLLGSCTRLFAKRQRLGIVILKVAGFVLPA
ncbi:MAG: hypothetical protein ABSG37_12665 [Candidatus Limnocylindrales bacterium]